MWKLQGLRFLKQKNYHQAIKCFQFSGERALALRCRAYILASEAQDAQRAVDTEIFELKRIVRVLSKRKKRDRILQVKVRRVEACQKFHKAGLAFERAKM